MHCYHPITLSVGILGICFMVVSISSFYPIWIFSSECINWRLCFGLLMLFVRRRQGVNCILEILWWIWGRGNENRWRQITNRSVELVSFISLFLAICFSCASCGVCLRWEFHLSVCVLTIIICLTMSHRVIHLKMSSESVSKMRQTLWTKSDALICGYPGSSNREFVEFFTNFELRLIFYRIDYH